MTKCFWYGHDLVTIEKFFTTDEIIPRSIRVCLRCNKIFDNITPYKEYLKQEKFNKLSRRERAQEIYANRYNPNA